MLKQFKNKIKKYMLVIVAFLSLCTSISSPTRINAASPNITAGAFTGYSVNVINSDGVHSEWNANYQAILIDGEYGFCVQPGYVLAPGNDFTPSAYTNRNISIIAYEGWVRSNHTMEDYLATQFMIWESLGGTIVSTSFSSYASYKSDIQNRIDHHNDQPSFNTSEITLNIGQSKTITDTNGVFNQYTLTNDGGLSITKNGNSLTITGTIDSPDNATIVYQKVPDSCVGTSIVYKKAGSQDAAKLYVSDPLKMYIDVKVNKFGSLKIAKQNNEGTLIPSTTFKLSFKANMSDPIGTYTTGADGTVTIDLLLPQTIYIQETSVPANLVLDPTITSINIIPNDTVSYTATNNIQKGKITLKKEDKDTGNKPQGDATLQGAIYGLFAKENIVDPINGVTLIAQGTKIAERTTKVDGAMDPIEDLYLGSYYVQELVASNGYEINPEKIDVLLNYAGATETVVIKDITSKEKVIDGAFKITKVIEVDPNNSEITKPEKDAEFVVVLKKYVDKYGSVKEAYKHKADFADKEYDLLITDKDGEDTSKKLAHGTYLAQQTKVGDENVDLLEKPFEVKIENENQPTIKYVISNQKFLSYLQLEKKDVETGKTVTLSKTSFMIYDVDNDKYLTQRVGLVRHDTWTTDETGKVTLPLKVPAGRYRLEEIKAPDGYLLNTDKIDFYMKESNVSIVNDENEPIQIVVFSNSKPTGSTKLIKSDKDSEETLSGVQYQLTAAEDVLDVADGSIIYKKGSPVSMDISENGYYITNELGEIEVEGLPLGSYAWKETRALDGYVQDTKEYTFELKQKDDVQKVYTHKEELTNQKTKVEILKEDVNNEALVGAHLRLVDENKQIVKEWVSKKGSLKLEGLLVGIEYTLYEDEAPEGYVISKPVKFIIKNTNEIQEIKMFDKQVTALKLDEDGDVLPGAKMQVVSTKTKDIVDQWISTEKEHNISNLIEGQSYILRELEAPDGLLLADDIEFTVNTKKDTQALEMTDKYILSEIKVNKVDYYDHADILKVAEFTIYTDKECTIPFKEEKTNTSNGIATFKNLRYGTWYIKETKAPAGYQLSQEVIKVVIDEEWVAGADKQRTIKFPDKLLPSSGGTGDNTDLKGWILLSAASLPMIFYLNKKRKDSKA